MNEREAKACLARELAGWRERSHADLVSLVGGEPFTRDVVGGEGGRYQLEIQVFRDSEAGGDIRVLGAVDDGGLRAFVPLTDDFIMAPDGRLVGDDPD